MYPCLNLKERTGEQFRMKPYIHAASLCESEHIGSGTRIWAFTRIMKNVVIGTNCNICDFVFIEEGVIIGNNVTIKSGVYLWNGVTIEDNVFVGPNATFTNDKYPKSGNRNFQLMKTILRSGCSIGANVTVLPGVEIGNNSIVGAGSVVTHDVPPNSRVFGNPARELNK